MAFDVIGNVQTLRNVPGELFFGEYDHRYTRESGTLENDATIAGSEPALTITKDGMLGLPVLKDTTWRFATTAEVGAADVTTEIWGFVISGEAITDLDADEVTGSEYAILVRGPALVTESLIPATDAYGDAIVAAEYLALAKALGIVSKPTPTTTVEQTT